MVAGAVAGVGAGGQVADRQTGRQVQVQMLVEPCTALQKLERGRYDRVESDNQRKG